MNYLYYGDNLRVLHDKRDLIADESVDLIYLDPPFNSSRNYNLLFKQQKGDPSPACAQDGQRGQAPAGQMGMEEGDRRPCELYRQVLVGSHNTRFTRNPIVQLV